MIHSATSPLQDLQLRLSPVRRRVAANAVLLGFARGLWLGATLALVAALAMWTGRQRDLWPGDDWLVWPGAAAIAVMVGLLVGVCTGLRRAPTWLSVAATVDAHFGLRDAALAGLQFAERIGDAKARPMEAMQIAQTLKRLDELDLRAAARVRIPWSLYGGMLSLVAAVGLFAWTISLGPPPQQPGEADRQAVVAAQQPTQEPSATAPPSPTRETAERVRETVEWQVAPSGEIPTVRSGMRFDEPLEQAPRAAAATAESSASPVPAPDQVPPDYRPVVRRYFQQEK